MQVAEGCGIERIGSEGGRSKQLVNRIQSWSATHTRASVHTGQESVYADVVRDANPIITQERRGLAVASMASASGERSARPGVI